MHRTRRDGQIDLPNTHFYVTNDYVIELAARHPKILFGASVHPYRADAVAEIERCVKAGTMLMKWLPITQNFSPADDKCIPFYEAIAHHKLPLLSHTGGEQSLPTLDKSVADPALLKPALDRGVTVIMAHCGTRAAPFERSYLDTFARLAKDYENCFGDTAALNLPMRWPAYDLLKGPNRSREACARKRLADHFHSAIFPAWVCAASMELMNDANWLRRDIAIKRKLGFDEDYWRRGACLLRVGERTNHRGRKDAEAQRNLF